MSCKHEWVSGGTCRMCGMSRDMYELQQENAALKQQLSAAKVALEYYAGIMTEGKVFPYPPMTVEETVKEHNGVKLIKRVIQPNPEVALETLAKLRKGE